LRTPVRNSLISMLVLISVLLTAALTLSACGSTGTAATGGAGSSLKTYTDSDYGYSFQYPDGWELHEGDSADVTAGGSSVGGVGVYDPKGASANTVYIDLVQISVYKLSVSVDESMKDEIKAEVESVLASLKSQAADMKSVNSLSEAKVAGMIGYRATYSFTKSGVPTTSTLYFLFKGNLEYQVTVQAATENWEKDQDVFDAIVASFKPGVAK
jgi:hypothetical protein